MGAAHVDADPVRAEPGPINGQLELFTATPELPRADAAAQAWTASPVGAEMGAAVAAFAEAHGWRPPTTRAVQRAVALLAVTGQQAHLELPARRRTRLFWAYCLFDAR